MKIGLDVDGVLTNLEEYQLKYGKKYFGESEVIQEDAYDICDIFGCDKSEREKFWTKYIWGYCLKDPLKENASDVLNRLKASGHEIHIITGRAHTTEQNAMGRLFRKMLLKRLEDEKIPYDTITYCSENGSPKEKSEICKKLGIDVMIDDKVENIMEIKENIPVICFDASYNKSISGDNIIHAENFYEVGNIIGELTEKNADNAFVEKNHEEISKMSNEEQIEYYKNLKEYYKKLPFDSKKYQKQERNYSLVATIGGKIFNKIFKPTAFNKENIPEDENVIFVSNHLNYYDQFQIISSIGSRPIHFLTATKMLNMKRGVFYKMTGAVSVDREDKNDRKNSKDEIIKILLNGKDVFIFPEGKTNRTKCFLNEFQPGAVAIAKTTGKKIVPMAVNDNYSKDSGPLCVRFGEPMEIKENDDIIQKTAELKANIGKLIWENMECVKDNTNEENTESIQYTKKKR